MTLDLVVYRRWNDDTMLFDAVRGLFAYDPGDDRATGQLYAEHEQDWPAEFAAAGRVLLDDLRALLAVRFTIVAFQGYRNGAGCGWHADDPFDAQAVLSLGASRTFGIRKVGGDPQWTVVEDGDLAYMPSGFQAEWQHCVPTEAVPWERISLVFRTVAKG